MPDELRHSTVAHANADGFGVPAPGCRACQQAADSQCKVRYEWGGVGPCIRPALHTEVFHKDAYGNYWVTPAEWSRQ